MITFPRHSFRLWERSLRSGRIKGDTSHALVIRCFSGSAKSKPGNNDKANNSLLLQHWYENAPEGKTLFIVFYTKACIWNRCAGCTFPSNSSSVDVGVENLQKQIDYIFNHLGRYNISPILYLGGII